MLLQITLTFLLTLTYVVATPPPGYQKKDDSKQDKNVPKYNYGYKIADNEGSQEKQEQRDGIYALGRYYVNGVDSKQSVEYLADDWGFHPFIEYSNTGPHSKSSTQIAFGEEAVKALRNSNKNEMTTKEEVERNIQKVQPQFVAQLPSQQPPNIVYVTHSIPPTAQGVPVTQSNVLFIGNHPQVNPAQPINIGPTQPTIDNQAVVYQTETKHQNENVAAQQQQQAAIVYVDSNQPAPGGYVIDQNQIGYQVQYADQNQYYTIPPNQENIILIPTAGPTPSGPFYVEGPTVTNQNIQQISNYAEENKDIIQKHKEVNVQIVDEPNKTKINEVNEYQQQNLISADTSSSEENFSAEAGLFGTKINAKLNVQPESHSTELKNSKLIENTKNLVTGQDVLNINEVLNQHVDSVIQADVSKSSEYSFSTTVTPSTEKPKETVSLSKDPIIVEDLEENKINVEEKGEFYSTTRSTVETVNTITSLGSQTTVVVTPRPVGTTFLAPITAGVQLETSNNKETAQQLKSSIVVDIQKSVPYYIGKFEYVHGPNGYEQLSNDAYKTKLQKTLLQYTEPLPSPQPLIQHISEDGSKVQFTGHENHVQEASDQQHESGQVQYQVQTPYQPQGNSGQQINGFTQHTSHTYNQKPINNKVKYHPLVQNLQTEIVSQHKYQPGITPMHLYIAAPDINPVVDLTKHFVVPTTYQPHVIHLPLIQNAPQSNYIQDAKIRQQQNAINEHQKEVQKQQYAILQQQKEVQKQIQDHEAQSSLQYASQHQSFTSQQQSLNTHEVLSKNPINEQKLPIHQSYVIEVPRPSPVAVTKLIPQPYPVTLTKPGKGTVPTSVQAKVPYSLPKYVERPYPIYLSKNTQQKFEHNPYVYAPNYQVNCDHLKEETVNTQGVQDSSSYVPNNQPTNYYHTIHLNDYLGLKPPKPKPSHKFIQFPRHTPKHQLTSSSINHNYKVNNLNPNYNVYGTGHVRKYRNPRQSFENLRIEYGFMPPLIPSIEIDEHGKPIEKAGKE